MTANETLPIGKGINRIGLPCDIACFRFSACFAVVAAPKATDMGIAAQNMHMVKSFHLDSFIRNAKLGIQFGAALRDLHLPRPLVVRPPQAHVIDKLVDFFLRDDTRK